MNDTWFKERKYAWIGLAALWIIGFIGALLRFIMATYSSSNFSRFEYK